MFAFCRTASIALLALISAAACADTSSTATAKRPNIIVIVADDQGYHDLGVQGAMDIKTPNIDALANGGVRFTQGYVTCPVCSPTRAGLLTGKYQQRFGHEFNPGPNGAENFGLPTDQKLLPNYLKQAGYATGAIGKWHLGMREECRPNKRGFDEFYGFLGGAHSYVPLTKGKNAANAIYRNNEQIEAPPYLTYAFNDEATKFVDRHKDHPFFLYLAYNAIHTPLQAAPGKEGQFPDIKNPQRQTMATMLAAMDEGIGKVMERLKANGIDDNTLIFYTADNGGPTAGNGSMNDPLSGFKGSTLEGGIRVPMAVRWPAVLPKGKVFDQPIISLDILPTVLAAAGTSAPPEAKVDGVNLLPYLKADKADKPHEALFWRFGPQFAVRAGDWKLVKTRTDSAQLFNLANDIGEKKDLASANPDKAIELQSAWDKWNTGNVAPLWHDSRHARQAERARPAEKSPKPGGKKARKQAMRNAQATSASLNSEDDE